METMKMRAGRVVLVVAVGLVATILPTVALGVPAFTAQDVGIGVPIDINTGGTILGQDAYADSPPWVLDGGVKTYLPLPPGATTAAARRINDGGVVVGQAANQPAIWWPTGRGYDLQLVPLPSGASVGRAIDVNTHEEVILTFGTPATTASGFNYVAYTPYLYTPQGELIDLASIYAVSGTTFPDPVDLTDGGRILSRGSSTARLSRMCRLRQPCPPRTSMPT